MTDREVLLQKVMVLNEQLWEGRVNRRRLDLWLHNFIGQTTDEDTERHYALLLLSNVMYFGERELRELLRVLFRDHYRYRVIQKIRRRLNGTTDIGAIHQEYDSVLTRTRFLPMGNPSESGTHLLYWFRQENGLSRKLFVHAHELSDRSLADTKACLADPTIERLVFLDDFCGSGAQAIGIAKALLPLIWRLAENSGITLDISYLVLFANASGIARVQRETPFNSVQGVFQLDESYRAFSGTARQFAGGPDAAARNGARGLAEAYGSRLAPDFPLGFRDGQLLLALHHNTPDNSLPILWAGPPEHMDWEPAFQRFPKYYGHKSS